MPRRHALSNAHLDQLLELPVEEADIIRHYTLSREDIATICRRRRPHNRLGFALQLCGLRYPGRLLHPAELVPESILNFVAYQLDILPDEIAGYVSRMQTRYEQHDALRELFGFRSMTQPDRRDLQTWLLPIALATVRPEGVARAFMAELRERKIAAPGRSVIARMVSKSLLDAERHVVGLLTDGLSEKQRSALDALFTPRSGANQSQLSWARQSSGALNTKSLSRTLDQLRLLRAVGINPKLADGVHPDRMRQLAREGARLSTQHFAALAVGRRRATLVATVLDTMPRLTDEAISTFERLIGRLFRRAERRAKDALQRDARLINEKVKLLAEIGEALIGAKAAGEDPYCAVQAVMDWPTFEAAVREAKALVRRDAPDYAALADSNHALLRRIGPGFLSAFNFQGVAAAKSVLKAADELRQYYAGARKALPKDMPTDFVRKIWRAAVFDGKEIDGKAYELCLFVELRDRLRAGDIWVVGSRQYRAVEDQLLPSAVFKDMAATSPLPISIPADCRVFLDEKRTLLRERLKVVSEKAAGDLLVDVRVTSSALKIKPLDAVTPDAAEELGARLYAMVPRIKITELLQEVAGLTSFTDCFTDLKIGATPPDARVLLTAILADATNLGFTRMADACAAASYKQLVWISGWHIREETHAAALEKLVKVQHAHPMAALFGDGISSSSDGQHFPVGGRAEVSGTVNPHKGTDPAISIYTHLSSRFAPFSSKTISATEGEAPFVLDGLINAGADLGISTHHTDGGGVSDHVFGICSILGFKFAPRIPNLSDRRLYTFDPSAQAGALEPFVGGRFDEQLIANHWNEVLRLATSIRTGHVSASLMLKRLGAYPRQNGLAMALREIGRIERTLFTLNWLEDPELRRKTSVELNKGESRNSLARAVCFHRLGRFRDRTFDGRQYRASSLNLVVAAIILWNTVYLGRAVQALRDAGTVVDDALLAHVAPLGWQHINLTGDYLWSDASDVDQPAWRPLRTLPTVSKAV